MKIFLDFWMFESICEKGMKEVKRPKAGSVLKVERW